MLSYCNGVTFCRLYRHGLYACIILETAHHRTTFGIFYNFIQKTVPEENSCKMFHISPLIVLFSYGKVKDVFFWDIRIKFHLGRTKGRGKRGYGWRSPKWAGGFFGFFCKIPIIKIKTLFDNGKYKLLFWWGRNVQNGLILYKYWFLDVLIPMVQVLRLYMQMFVSSRLYVYITLENAHYRTTFGIFCNITQNTTSEENSCKMFHISSLIVLFSYGKVKDISFGIRIKFHWREQKV